MRELQPISLNPHKHGVNFAIRCAVNHALQTSGRRLIRYPEANLRHKGHRAGSVAPYFVVAPLSVHSVAINVDRLWFCNGSKGMRPRRAAIWIVSGDNLSAG